MSKLNGLNLLGVFPDLDPFGGVEASGRIAWNGLLASDQVDVEGLQLFEYKANGLNGSGPTTAKAPSFTTSARAKAGAILKALNTRRRPHRILVWHIGLLKLLPFFRSPEAQGVLYLHGIESWKRQDLLTQRALRRVGLFLTNSDFTWSRFLSYHPEFATTRHLTVGLGIGDSFSGGPTIPDPRPMVMMIGRMAEGYKGHKEIIQAWPKVVRRFPGVTLCIVGGGDLRPELETLAGAQTPSGSVQFVGEVSEEQKEALLLKSRCLAMPSSGEGFGLVYLEAMRLGRPCLVSTLDAGREVVNPPEAGLAVDPQNQSELADALCRLIQDGEEWRTWSANARRRYDERYTAHHFQERLLAALFPDKVL